MVPPRPVLVFKQDQLRNLERLLDRAIDSRRGTPDDLDPAVTPKLAADPEEQAAALAELAEVEANVTEIAKALADGALSPILAQQSMDLLEDRRTVASERFAAVSAVPPVWAGRGDSGPICTGTPTTCTATGTQAN